MMFNRTNSLLMVMIILLISMQAHADSPKKLVDKGNRAFAMGKYDKALEAYEAAGVEMPESAHVYFNKGAALYRKKDFKGAKEAFEQAALKSRTTRLEAKARFNLGLCSFREAEHQKDGDLDKALEACGKSIRHFQEALKLDPGFTDAAENIEVVRLTMKSILDEANKRKEEAEKQQEAMKKAARRIKELMEKQQEMLERNRYFSEEKEQKGDSPDLKTKIADLAREQNDLALETRKTSQTMPSPGQSGQSPGMAASPVKEHLKEAASEGEAASDKLKERMLDRAEPHQQKVLDELKKALDSLKKNGDNSKGKKREPDQKQNRQQTGQDRDKNKGQNQKKGDADNKKKATEKKAQSGSAGKQQDQKKGDEQKAPKMQLPDNARQILYEEKKNRNMRSWHQAGGFSEVDKDW